MFTRFKLHFQYLKMLYYYIRVNTRAFVNDIYKNK